MWTRVLWQVQKVQDQAEKVRVGKIMGGEKAFAVVHCSGYMLCKLKA